MKIILQVNLGLSDFCFLSFFVSFVHSFFLVSSFCALFCPFPFQPNFINSLSEMRLYFNCVILFSPHFGGIQTSKGNDKMQGRFRYDPMGFG